MKPKQEYRIAFIDPDGHTEYSEWTCDERLGYGYHLGWLRALQNGDEKGRTFELEQRDSVSVDRPED